MLFGICRDCNKKTDEIDFHDHMASRCLDCKKKRLGREPRELTEEEVRERFLKQVAVLIQYWETESRTPDLHGKMTGLAFSILSMLDGCSMGIPGFIVAPSTNRDDKAHRQAHHEDWYPQNHEANVNCDISGGLRDQLYKYVQDLIKT